MERLTYDFVIGRNHCWEVKGADNYLCKDVCKNQGDNGCEGCPIREAIDRLAAYENTGLMPEEVMVLCSMSERAKMADLLRLEEYQIIGPIDNLRELAQAEKDGRLVVLPCRVTDTVYITEYVFENGIMKKLNRPNGEQVVSAQIDHVTIGGMTGKPVFDLCTETGNWYYSMDPEQLYLTREEAEAALGEQEV